MKKFARHFQFESKRRVCVIRDNAPLAASMKQCNVNLNKTTPLLLGFNRCNYGLCDVFWHLTFRSYGHGNSPLM